MAWAGRDTFHWSRMIQTPSNPALKESGLLESALGTYPPCPCAEHPQAGQQGAKSRAGRQGNPKGRSGSSQVQTAGFSHFYCKALGRANYNGVGHLDSSANERNRGRTERGGSRRCHAHGSKQKELQGNQLCSQRPGKTKPKARRLPHTGKCITH